MIMIESCQCADNIVMYFTLIKDELKGALI